MVQDPFEALLFEQISVMIGRARRQPVAICFALGSL